MAKVIVASRGQADLISIQKHLRIEAGSAVARNYAVRFLNVFDQLKSFPGSGAPRHQFGSKSRIAIVPPYIVWYEFDDINDTVSKRCPATTLP